MATIEEALAYWQQKKLITAKKAEELRADMPQSSHTSSDRAIGIFSAVGAILVGLGVILFVGSNWHSLSPLVKITILLLGMIGTGVSGYYLAYERGAYQKTGLGLLFVNILIYGASIFLVAQIYHLPINFSLGAFLWFIGALFFAYLLHSRLHTWLSIPLFLLFVGWTYSTTSHTANEIDFLGDPKHSILTLLPAISVGLFSLSILHRKYKDTQFAVPTLFNWAVFLAIFVLVITTADKSLFFNFMHLPLNGFVMATIVISFLLFVLAFFTGKFETSQGKWSLLAFVLYLAFLSLLAQLPLWIGFSMDVVQGNVYLENSLLILSGLFVVHVILVLVFLLSIIWYGTLLKLPSVINLGMMGLACTIILQYFSWAFTQLDRSVAFIIGGIFILVLSAALERQRRHILSSIA
jgi:uncharacterized membrane protein